MAVDKKTTPIRRYFLNTFFENYISLFTIDEETHTCVNMVCSSPFTLGLLIGCVMNRFVRYGVSFDSMVITPSENRIVLKVRNNLNDNKMKIEWK